MRIVVAFIGLVFTVLVNAKEQTPNKFLVSCFRDYVAAFSSGKSGKKTAEVVRLRCLSKKLNEQWQSLVSVDNLDADAFLLAQDFQDSWKTEQKVKNLNPTRLTADVVLGKGSEEHCIHINYETSASGPKISKIQDCSAR